MQARLNSWSRKGDLNELGAQWKSFLLLKQVRYYYCTMDIVYIKSMLVVVDEYNSIATIVISTSPFYREEFFHLSNELFGYVYCDKPGEVEIEIRSNFLQCFDRLINYNKIFRNQFTSDIVEEIKKIVLTFQSTAKSKQNSFVFPKFIHRIPIDDYYIDFTKNPLLRESKRLMRKSRRLTDYMLDHACSKNYDSNGRKLHRLLAEGEHPNDGSGTGNSFLSAMSEYFNTNIRLLKLVLVYGAQYNYPDPCENLSPLECAFRHRDYNVVNFCFALSTVIEKPTLAVNKLLMIHAHGSHHKIVSSFCFPQGELHSTLKPTLALTDEELEGLHALYRQCFDGTQAGINCFTPEANKYIDIIRNESGKIVGAVVYKVRQLKDKIWLNIDIELFDKHYPNHGIMPVVTYSFAYALQMLYPDLAIWVVFLSAHFSSFMRIKDQLAIPKYQPEGKVAEVIAVLKQLFGSRFHYRYDPASICYLREADPAQVKGPAQSASPSLDEWLYQEFRRAGEEIDEATLKKRNVLVALPLTYEFLASLQEIAAKKGINFYRVAIDLVKQLHLTGLMRNHAPATRPQFFAASQLFWDNQRLPSQEANYQKLNNEPIHRVSQAKL